MGNCHCCHSFCSFFYYCARRGEQKKRKEFQMTKKKAPLEKRENSKVKCSMIREDEAAQSIPSSSSPVAAAAVAVAVATICYVGARHITRTRRICRISIEQRDRAW